MTDKKPGFFKRLFGGDTPVPPDPVPHTPAPPLDEEPAAEAPLPGPPETTPDYIEDLEDPVAAPTESPVPSASEEAPRQSWFTRLSTGLKRSSDQLTGSITSVFTKRKLDAATLDELEDVLIQADLGIETAMAITETLRRDRFDRDVSGEDVRAVLAAEVERVLAPVALPLSIDEAHKPFIILMIGVNGSGKTTTIGKLAQKFAHEGRSVMLAAGDTFR